MASLIGCMDIIYAVKMADMILLQIFALILAVFVWKQHFLFFIWKKTHKMVDIGSNERRKRHDNRFSPGFDSETYYWDNFSFCKRCV